MSSLLVCVIAVMLALVAPVSAQESPPVENPAAKAHADAGSRLFDVQQYDKAAAEFEQAYLLDAQPVYLYALAQAQRLAGDCTKAIRSYENLLRTQPEEKIAALANANIERCKEMLAAQSMKPAEPSAQVQPSPSTPAAAVTTTALDPSPWYEDRFGHVLVGSGVAVAATGLVLYFVGERAIRDHNAAATYDEFQAGADLSTARLEQKLGVAAIAVGGGLIAGGIIHYVLHTRTPAEHTVTANVTAQHATLAFGWVF